MAAEVNVIHTVPGCGDPTELLATFGLKSFRPGQRDVVDAVADGHDCLCIMPTGGGKSLCYQLPALARDGTTLVVSPLIALMKDQVDTLQSLGINARLLNSSLSQGEQDQVMQEMADGKAKLVYIAPERLRNGRFLEAIRTANVNLLAVDEAHCVSEWGHDFRPDYSRLGHFRKRYLGDVQTIALTATATPIVRDDICALLNLSKPTVFVTGFARTNLRFGSDHFNSDNAKKERLSQLVESIDGTGIIYASTRKNCDEIAAWLPEKTSKRVGVYHAGLEPAQRQRVQEAFMGGKLSAIVATNAFGMGIDKSDIRYVVHYNMPGSLEAYYQEAGRAGRDGKMSLCRLLFSYQDRYIQEFFIENRYPSKDTVRKVYEYLLSRDEDPIELTLDQIRDAINEKGNSESIGTAESLLARAGVLKRLDSNANHAMVRVDSDAPTLLDFLPREAKIRRAVMRAIETVVDKRRHEDVYVTPHRLSELAGVDRDQLSRTLRELRKLRSFDYVPPFRGRAVHFTQRDVPFDKLEIDFPELERRKRAEYEKLDAVISFARTSGCRQRVILNYFGDPKAANCSICDRCDPKHAESLDAELAVAAKRNASNQKTSKNVDQPLLHRGVQVVLSGVTRTHGRFGRALVAQMLCGSKSKKLQQWKLNRLSTYGLLTSMKQTEVAEVMDELVSTGLLKQTEVDQRRPTIHLTDQGRRVMKAQSKVPSAFQLSDQLAKKLIAAVRHLEAADVKTATATDDDDETSEPIIDADPAGDTDLVASHPEPSVSKQDEPSSPEPNDSKPIDVAALAQMIAQPDPGELARTDLIDILKRFRRKRSAALGIGPHQVMSVATIQRIAKAKPTTISELAAVDGCNPELMDAIGQDLLQLVTDRLAEDSASDAGPIEDATIDEGRGEKVPDWGGLKAKKPATDRTDGTDAAHLHSEGCLSDGSRSLGSPKHESRTLEVASTGEVPSRHADGEYYWTWKLLRDGYTVDQVQEIRGVSPGRILEHLAQAAKNDLSIDPHWTGRA